MQSSDLRAYKSISGINVGFHMGPNKVIASNMRVTDNAHGLIVGAVASSNDHKPVGVMNDNIVRGDTDSPDCP